MLYSFTFEQKVDWSRPYATQPEIDEYLVGVVEKYGLTPHIRYGSDLREARWDDAASPRGGSRPPTAGRRARTSRQRASACSTACAGRPSRASTTSPGLTVHSGAWPDAGVDLRCQDGRGHRQRGERGADDPGDRREQAARLDVYQRTANWVFPKDDIAVHRRGDRGAGGATRRSPLACATEALRAASSACSRTRDRELIASSGEGQREPRAGARPRAARAPAAEAARSAPSGR